MAAFSDEEKRILANILPGVAAALRSPLNNLHMAAQRLTQGQEGDSAESAIMRQSYYRMLRLVSNLAMGPELLSDKPFQTQNEELVVLLDELEKAFAAGDNTEEETERTARIKALLFAISL